jgi:hypothetical protein
MTMNTIQRYEAALRRVADLTQGMDSVPLVAEVNRVARAALGGVTVPAKRPARAVMPADPDTLAWINRVYESAPHGCPELPMLAGKLRRTGGPNALTRDELVSLARGFDIARRLPTREDAVDAILCKIDDRRDSVGRVGLPTAR